MPGKINGPTGRPISDPTTPVEPVEQHLADVGKKIQAPTRGVPPNIQERFGAKGGAHSHGQISAKSRNFRHQGR